MKRYKALDSQVKKKTKPGLNQFRSKCRYEFDNNDILFTFPSDVQPFIYLLV